MGGVGKLAVQATPFLLSQHLDCALVGEEEGIAPPPHQVAHGWVKLAEVRLKVQAACCGWHCLLLCYMLLRHRGKRANRLLR